MRNVWFCVASCLVLAGCADAPSAPSSDSARADQGYCESIAKARVRDAVANGFEDVREQVYSETYSDCVAWQPKARVIVQK